MTFQSEGHFLISSLAPGLVSILHCFGPRSVPQESVCSGGVQQYLAACMEVLTARALAPGPQSQGTCPHHCTLPTALCPQTSQTPEIGSLLNSWDVSLLRLNGMRQTKIFYSEKLRKRKMKWKTSYENKVELAPFLEGGSVSSWKTGLFFSIHSQPPFLCMSFLKGENATKSTLFSLGLPLFCYNRPWCFEKMKSVSSLRPWQDGHIY